MQTITLQTPLETTFRTAQIAGMFDVPAAEKLTQTIQYEDLPSDNDWTIGVITGPSGSGKTAIARHWLAKLNGESGTEAVAGNLCQATAPKHGVPVINLFEPLPVKETVKLLTTVGFSSPPSWLKPYNVLSNGEKFRVDLALSLCPSMMPAAALTEVPLTQKRPTVIFDEYSSVVDRTVAAVCSTALGKSLRSGQLRCRFVAVTCHHDIIGYLEPDWVLDTATGRLSRRLLRRQPFELEIFRCKRSLWRMFKRHHYLSAALPNNVQCYAALLRGEAAAFCAVIPQYGQRRWFRISRLVTLPDYQGIGIGSQFMEAVGDLYLRSGKRFSITGTHRSIIEHCQRSGRWRLIGIKKLKKGRITASFVLIENKLVS